MNASEDPIPNLQDAVKRLRALLQQERNPARADGFEDGRLWAIQHASLAELRALDQIVDLDDLLLDPDAAPYRLYWTMCPGDDGDNDVAEFFWDKYEFALSLHPEHKTDYLCGFVEGAMDVWHKVQPHLTDD